MSEVRLLHLCDTHLSATHAYFEDNWHAVADAIRAEGADLIVHGGDVSFNGPARPDDLTYAAAEIAALGLPWLAVAGNHDIGEAPGYSRLDQPVNDARIAAWRERVGPLWWVRDVGDWRLVGLDTALMASGRHEEEEQAAFLADALARREGRPVMVFVHMPPFSTTVDDPTWSTGSVPFPARGPFLDACAQGGVKVIACGHLHVHRRIRHRGMEIVWGPTTAMVDTRSTRSRTGPPRPGYLVWDLVGRRATHRLVTPERAFVIDMKGWTLNNGGTTTTLPPLPLRRPALAAPDRPGLPTSRPIAAIA